MPYGNRSQRIRRGQSWTLAGLLQSSGSNVNLTSATGLLSVNTWPKGLTPVYTSNNVIFGGTAGTFSITVPASVTSAWPSNGPFGPPTNILIYDLVLTLSDGVTVIIPLSGQLVVEEVAGS
jgi:hypothetical protein